MYELSNLNDYIDAVLLNNPAAVQERMYQLGILQEGSWDPDYLKQVIVRRFQDGKEVRENPFFLPEVLDVPVELNNPQADELLNYHLAKGNRAMVESLLLKNTLTDTSTDWNSILQTKIGWQSAFQIMGLVIGLLLIIFLIRKI